MIERTSAVVRTTWCFCNLDNNTYIEKWVLHGTTNNHLGTPTAEVTMAVEKWEEKITVSVISTGSAHQSVSCRFWQGRELLLEVFYIFWKQIDYLDFHLKEIFSHLQIELVCIIFRTDWVGDRSAEEDEPKMHNYCRVECRPRYLRLKSMSNLLVSFRVLGYAQTSVVHTLRSSPLPLSRHIGNIYVENKKRLMSSAKCTVSQYSPRLFIRH